MTTLGPYGYFQGLNTNSGPYDSSDHSYVDAVNVEVVQGRINKRNGNALWDAAPHPGAGQISGLALFQSTLVAAGGAKVASIDSTASGGTYTDVTGVITLGTNNPMASLNSILVIACANNQPFQWTGTGNTTLLGGYQVVLFGSTCVAMVNNYMFLGGPNANPSRVYWSAIQDPNTWPATNYVDVRKDDGSPVMATISFGEDLLIFKRNCVARLYTTQLATTLGPLVMVSDTLGCAGPDCVDHLPDGRVAFIGFDNHVYIYDGSTFEDISNPPFPMSNIQNTLNSLVFRSKGFNQGSLCVYKGKSQIWISYPFTYTGTLHTYSVGVIFIYDIQLKSWVTAYPDHRVYKMLNYVDPGSGSEYLITAGNSHLYQEDIGSTNSDTLKQYAYEAYVTRSIRLPDEFRPRSVLVPFNSGTLTSSLYYGYNGYKTPSSTASIVTTGSAAERRKVVLVNSTSQVGSMQIRLFGGNNSEPFTFNPISISDEVLN